MNNLSNHPYYYYYTIGNQKFSTKLFALYAREKLDDKQIVWHFSNWENALSKIDITKEPEESLQDLYLQRAQQLRNEYDYLILFYSGGHDSNQILETFMLNNIFLDEILIMTRGNKVIIDKMGIFPEYYEPIKSAIPQAKFYVENFSPKTKITIIENMDSLNSKYLESLTKPEIKNLITSCSPGITHRLLPRTKDINSINLNWTKLHENKKVGHIFGKEKVRILYDDIGYYIVLSDAHVVDHIDLKFLLSKNNLPNSVELFYIHPNFVKIQVKQAHILIKNISKDKISSEKNLILGTREIEDLYSNFIYKFKYNRLYFDSKHIEIFISNKKIITEEEKKEILKKSLSDDVTKYFTFYNETAFNNYKTILNTIESCFFPNKNKKLIIENCHTGIATKKYYVRYFK